jgi:hypothetical protein
MAGSLWLASPAARRDLYASPPIREAPEAPEVDEVAKGDWRGYTVARGLNRWQDPSLHEER